MNSYSKKTAPLLLAAFFVLAISFFPQFQRGTTGVAEASLWDTIIGIVAINPLHVSISVPAEAELGRNFKAQIIVENRGDERISEAGVQIFISKGLVLVNKNAVKKVGTIRGSSTKNIFWQVKGTEAGNFSISVSASAVVRGDVVTAQGNTALGVIIEKSPPPRPKLSLFQRFLGFFSRWF